MLVQPCKLSFALAIVLLSHIFALTHLRLLGRTRLINYHAVHPVATIRSFVCTSRHSFDKFQVPTLIPKYMREFSVACCMSAMPSQPATDKSFMTGSHPLQEGKAQYRERRRLNGYNGKRKTDRGGSDRLRSMEKVLAFCRGLSAVGDREVTVADIGQRDSGSGSGSSSSSKEGSTAFGGKTQVKVPSLTDVSALLLIISSVLKLNCHLYVIFYFYMLFSFSVCLSPVGEYPLNTLPVFSKFNLNLLQYSLGFVYLLTCIFAC